MRGGSEEHQAQIIRNQILTITDYLKTSSSDGNLIINNNTVNGLSIIHGTTKIKGGKYYFLMKGSVEGKQKIFIVETFGYYFNILTYDQANFKYDDFKIPGNILSSREQLIKDSKETIQISKIDSEEKYSLEQNNFNMIKHLHEYLKD